MADNIFYSMTSSLGNLFGGIFRRALNITRRPWLQNLLMNSKSPVLVDMENLLQVYQSCPYLATVINRKADMLASGVLKVRNKKTKVEVEDHWALDFMKKPNPLQKFKEFTRQYSIYSDIYANAFVYRNMGVATKKVKVLWNLPPQYMQVKPTGKWIDQFELSGIVEGYQYYLNGVNANQGALKTFTTDEVIHTSSGISETPLVANSKLIALQHPISNIIGALKTRNIFIYYGPKMILSNQGKDDGGAIPLDPNERERIEKAVNQDHYGIQDNQSHMVITNAAMQVQMMTYPTKDLMLFEEIEEDFGAICGAFGMDRDIFPSVKGATFENKKNGEVATFQNTIEPAACSYTEMLTDWVVLEEQNEFYMDYSDLPIMQEDKVSAGKAYYSDIQALSLLFHDGIISPDTYAEEAEIEMTGDGVIKQSSAKAPAATDPNAAN
jgi:hypothetical protein